MLKHFEIRYEFLTPLAGILFAFSFAPLGWSYFAIIALAILFLSWRNVSPAKGAFYGFLFGLGLFGFGVSWVFVSVHYYGGASILGSGLLTLFFAVFWALFPALTGYLCIKFKVAEANRWFFNVVIWAAIWMLVENFRGYWLLNGFPWFQVAYSQIDTPLAGFVPLLGVYGTGFIGVLSALLLAEALLQKQNRVILLSAVVGLWVLGGMLSTVKWTTPQGDKMTVALIQGNISQDQKWASGNRLKTLLKYKQLTEDNWDAKVIVWPETAIPAFLSQVDDFFLKPLEAEAQLHQSDLVVSLPIEGEGEHEIYNGVLTLGHERKIYKKNHLLPFGEYLPLQPLSGWVLKLLGVHLGDFTAGGAQQELLTAGGYQFATSICYEDGFGGEVASNSRDAAYLVNVTNDAWFGNSLEPHQHFEIARMRALETGRYLLRATNTGITAIVGPDGKVVKQAVLFEAAVLKGEIEIMHGITPYVLLGDNAILLAISVLLVAVLLVEKFYFIPRAKD